METLESVLYMLWVTALSWYTARQIWVVLCEKASSAEYPVDV